MEQELPGNKKRRQSNQQQESTHSMDRRGDDDDRYESMAEETLVISTSITTATTVSSKLDTNLNNNKHHDTLASRQDHTTEYLRRLEIDESAPRPMQDDNQRRHSSRHHGRHRSSLDNDEEDDSSSGRWTDPETAGGLMIPSVSMGNLALVDDAFSSSRWSNNGSDLEAALSNHIVPNGRNRMFNCSFKIWKKRDLKASTHRYHCGHIFNVRISHLGDSAAFYVQEHRLLEDLAKVEASIQNYAHVLVTSVDTRANLLSYQRHAVKTDLVLARTKADGKWRRAVLVDRAVSNEDGEMVEINPNEAYQVTKALYTTFFFIDWGLTETVVEKRRRSDETTFPLDGDLFILPIHDLLLSIGAFALRCSINQCHLKRNEKFVRDDDEVEKQTTFDQQQLREEFEKAFRARLVGKLLKMRITRATSVKNDLEAIVELFYFPTSDSKTAVNCVKQIVNELSVLNNKQHTTNDDDGVESVSEQEQLDSISFSDNQKVF